MKSFLVIRRSVARSEVGRDLSRAGRIRVETQGLMGMIDGTLVLGKIISGEMYSGVEGVALGHMCQISCGLD